MKYQIKNRWDGSILYQDEAESFSALVQAAIKEKADLQWADLQGANLQQADLPAPTLVLLSFWGSLSDELTADLMLLDASAHPSTAAFDAWAKGGPCPYQAVKVQRIANFTENKTLWGKGKADTIYNLMVRVLKEKTKQ